MKGINLLEIMEVKKYLYMVLFVVLPVMVFLVGCAKTVKKEPEEEEGGVRIDSSYDAPKEIKSTEIEYFYCEFSNLTMMDKDTFLENKVYELKAVLEDGMVQGSYESYAGGEGKKDTFVAEVEFMDVLQKIVKNHNLAQNNGHVYKVSGLPDQFGALLQIEYESGERIYASNNQDNFLTIAVMEALDELFRMQLEESGKLAENMETGKTEVPKVLDVKVSKQFDIEHVNGRYVSIEYPLIELGYEENDGECQNGEVLRALEEALNDYNREEQDFHVGSRSVLRNAANNIEETGEEPLELYTTTDAYITRNDTKVLSFYTFTKHFEGWIRELYDWEARNFDIATGKNLEFKDVFTNLEEAAQIAAAEIRAAYPEQQFYDEMEELVFAGMKGNEDMIFALSYDCVHIFAKNQYLSADNIKGQHIVLAYSDYPELVKETYRETAKNWMMKLDYGVVYPLTPTMYFEMKPEYADDEVIWSTRVNGISREDIFYRSAPDCYLVCVEEQYYIYLRVPMGDTTLLTHIYQVTEEGVEFLGEVEGAMHEEVNYNPEHIRIY